MEGTSEKCMELIWEHLPHVCFVKSVGRSVRVANGDGIRVNPTPVPLGVVRVNVHPANSPVLSILKMTPSPFDLDVLCAHSKANLFVNDRGDCNHMVPS